MTHNQFLETFPTEEAAIEYFLNIRYGGKLACPHCGKIDYVYRYNGNLKLVQCHSCNNSFSPFSGTIFEKTHKDMRDWFFAIHLLLNDKKGVSACNLQRELGCTYRTAWRMEHKIREAMGNTRLKKDFDCIVEIDETYVGGKPRKQNALVKPDGTLIPRKYPAKNKRGRGTDKTPVVGVKERSTGKVYAKVMLPNEEGQKLTGKQLLEVLATACKDKTTVVSDDFSGYKILDKKHANDFIHLSINHSLGEYCNFKDKDIHTNGIENFWSLLKRQYHGTHHHWSVKHMQKYVDEMAFRQSNRKNEKIFDLVLEQAIEE
jgi:transposase-like protein